MTFDPSMAKWPIKLFIFDMDGTLIDSGLDFDAMREELGVERGAKILEAIKKESNLKRKKEMMEIISRHEWEGAKRCTLIDGAKSLVSHVRESGHGSAILTRNRKDVTEYSLNKFSLKFDLVLAREDVIHPKPHPEGIHKICEELNIPEQDSLYVGDFEHDLIASNAAGTFTVFYARTQELVKKYNHLANYTVTHLDHLREKIS